MATKSQILSREMILPAYKAAISPRLPLYICRQPTKDYVRNYKLFIQNKPNFPKSQINVSKVLERDYENIRLRRRPKTNPIKPNFYTKNAAHRLQLGSKNLAIAF